MERYEKMIPREIHRPLTVCFSAVAVLSCVIAGCARTASHDDVERYEELRSFVSEAVFVRADPESAYPDPADAPPRVLEYARREYGTNREVRRLLAIYFLRYDSVVIARGLITAHNDPKCLIGLLWDKEASGWAETPSMNMMRDHIAGSTERLGLDASDMKLLEANMRAFDKLAEFWKRAGEQ